MRGSSISYLKTRGHSYEVDFVVGDALFGDAEGLAQVTRSLEDGRTRNREIRALAEAMGEGDVERGTIVVEDGKQELVPVGEGRAIEIVPAWSWFLSVL